MILEKEVCERIKQARKLRKMTQGELAKAVDLTSNYIYLIESGRNEPGRKAIKEICNVLNVREEWIYTGEEPIEYPPEDETAAYVGELLGDEENPLYDIIKAIMKTYSGLGAKDQELIRTFAKQFKDNLKEENRS